jgi:hypothetical protein
MKKFCTILLLHLAAANPVAQAQSATDSVQFFMGDGLIKVSLTTDLGRLLSRKLNDENQKAVFSCRLADSTVLNKEIRIKLRGHARRDICYLPPISLLFHNPGSPAQYSLNSLKLVNSCQDNTYYEQFLLKEYLIYKIYNLLSEKSFKVRLLHLTCIDNKEKKKSFTRYAFLLEDIDALAKRNSCKELNNRKVWTESTDRAQMTMMAIFQYMIGNTDWSVPTNHNIKLIVDRHNTTAKPYAVPYDFDYAGLVNADYAIPGYRLDIKDVTQRLYRGFPRTMDELQAALKIYQQQRENIYALINNLEPLSKSGKKEMIYYLDNFYELISDPRKVKYTFIDDARLQ